MNLKNLICTISAVALLSACVATAPKLNMYDPLAVESSVVVKRDDFKKTINYQGPNAATDPTDYLVIRAWKYENTQKITYQIYVADYYSGEWRFYNAAYGQDGTPLDTTLISRDVSGCSKYGCSHTEHIGLNVSREYLEKFKEYGLKFKISGKAGEEIFFVPGPYIQAILNVVK